MGISSVLSTALQGLSVTSSALEVVSANVANADTTGYTSKSLTVRTLITNGTASSVIEGNVRRDVDSLLVKQIRQENAGLGYVEILEKYYGQLDSLYGEPGSETSIDTLYANFQSSLDALVASPDDYTTREQFLRDAQTLAESLNDMSDNIQAMRLQAEQEISDTVDQINSLLQSISDINTQLSGSAQFSSPDADLLDLRDGYLLELSELIDINVVEGDRGVVTVSTTSGTSLLSPTPATLVFDERGTVTAEALYSSDSDESGVGTVKIITGNGGEIDLIRDNQIQSGKLAGLLELRDGYLVDAQAQLDAVANALASAFNTINVDATAATSGTQSGFDIDLAGIQSGDTVSLTYTIDGVEQNVTLVAVEDASALPLDNDVTADPNDTVIGFDISGGIAAAATALNTALSPEVEVTSGGGDVLRFLDDGDGSASSAGALYGADGSTLDLSALVGESITVTVNGVDNTFNFTGADTGQDLQTWIDGLGDVSASVVAGELVITGDTADDSFAISFSDASVGTATGLSEGSYNTTSLSEVSAGITATSLTGDLAMPLFLDGALDYTGSVDGTVQQVGFASRITLNPDLLNDNTALVLWDSDTLIGDSARPDEMLSRLTDLDYYFSTETKVAGSTPYDGTISGYIDRMFSYQAAVASDIYSAADAQETVSAQLAERFQSDSGVDVDKEMSRLIELQTAYQANARVISVYQEMMDTLLGI